MYHTLIVEPQEASLKTLLNLPVWDKEPNGFVCSKIAANGKEALELINTEKFDLILTEINLSVCDGLQLLKQIHKEYQPPLVVFISDIISFSYAREGFIYGAFDYLPKPVDKEEIQALFKRASTELEKYAQRAQQKKSISEYHPYFTKEEVDKIINGVIHQTVSVLDEFHNVITALYHAPKHNHPPDMLVNKLYTYIIDGIYAHKDWLPLYLPLAFHKQPDYLILNTPEDYTAYYVRRLTYLYDFICQLNPIFHDETLTKVSLYVLYHPDEDLKLTSVANKFYLNHTYLSNLFSKKSNIRYSQLVTIIKLRRAEYLINYTDIPIIDIAYQLGYTDFHYFTRLFKKIIGKAPSDYVRNNCDHFNYLI